MAAPSSSVTEAVIPASALRGVLHIAQREGRAIDGWLAGTGLSPDDLWGPDEPKLSFEQSATILRQAVAAMPGRALGMEIGGRDVLMSFGLLGVAMRSCATIADAVSVGLELHQAAGSLVDIDVDIDDAGLWMILRERSPEPELIAYLCEEHFCSTLVLLRSVFGADHRPLAVELAYAEPAYVETYHEFFGCPVRFDCAANAMIFPSAMLDEPLPTHHEPTRAAAVAACQQLVGLHDPRPDLVVTLEMLLSRDLRRPMSMSRAAKELHLTERTLRRRLALVGDSFSAVRDRVREHRATSLLKETSLTVEAIAHEVGFAEAREFRRAYRRWTGQAPGRHRQ